MLGLRVNLRVLRVSEVIFVWHEQRFRGSKLVWLFRIVTLKLRYCLRFWVKHFRELAKTSDTFEDS